MKRKMFFLLVILICIVSIISTTYAGDIRNATETSSVIYTETLTLSADGSAQEFEASVSGSYLYQVEILTSDDDAVTFTINSALGTQLYTTTTTSATSGEIELASNYYSISKHRTPTYTLSGLGTGTATIEVTFIKK